MGRVFKYFQAQKRMAVIAATFSQAATDLAHYFVTFTIVFAAYSVIGYISFGTKVERFHSFMGSFNQVYKMALGELDLDGLVEVAGTLGLIYYYTFTMMVISALDAKGVLTTPCIFH